MRLHLNGAATLPQGRRVAQALARSWRADLGPGTAPAPTDLEAACRTGGVAGLLAWRHGADSPAGTSVLRWQALEYAVRRDDVARMAGLLAHAGLRPLFGKGWALARLYPSPALRPPGDVDVYLPASDGDAALAVLKDEPLADVHRGFSWLDDRPADVLYAHAECVVIDNVPVDLFGPEHHLRLVALHLIGHGGVRPLWLCDVAVALEQRPSDFDWSELLAGDPTRTAWVQVALQMARDLLGADCGGVPHAALGAPAPAWVAATILHSWGTGRWLPHGMRAPFAERAAWGTSLGQALLQRWPNAMEASLQLGRGPRAHGGLAVQLASCVRRLRGHMRRPSPSGGIGATDVARKNSAVDFVPSGGPQVREH